MRKLNKYCFFLKTRSWTLKKIPSVILSFHKAKWFEFNVKYKKRAVKKKKKKFYKCSFINIEKRSNIFRKWIRFKQGYNNKVILKRLFYMMYGGALKAKYWNSLHNNTSHTLRVSEFLIKPYLYLEILLWNLNFSKSRYEAKKLIQKKFIYINNNIITKTKTVLKKGDILFLRDKNHLFNTNLKNIKSTYTSDKKFLSFIEFDFYINSITVIKSMKELHSRDFPLIVKDRMPIKNWRLNL